ncbi:Pyoverdine/dityrosine biosynthesis protein Dit1 [Pseudomonas antarctica]|uniref:Pyoverdine/dityrosine biosynthesis protein n=1 Tax=Pseudomonas antarctica TaxID=219572 RepID=A0A1G9XK34_9PSED|nr:L-tyrosine/L-tryptophan isonitrile synthase family protein [Pseudomonas antarctica]KAF2410008.1 pyoverdine/dityrosine biosynthesis protein [Pseudomonas antarctica]SDM96575.1 Pyoverdine/dityrosine biosynthesis protein Dit1 [Pseudomonas antarctica]
MNEYKVTEISEFIKVDDSHVVGLRSEVEDKVDELIVILLTQLLSREKILYRGFKTLKDQVARQVALGQPLKFVIPAFPCKSVNTEKCLGSTPDLAEWMALKKIVSVIRNIEELYEPGILLTIFSDYHTFSSYISVSQDNFHRYCEALKSMVKVFCCGDAIKIKSLSDYPEFASHDETNYMEVLKTKFGDSQYEAGISEEIKCNSDTNEKYTALKKFMKDDQWPLIKGIGKSAINCRLSEISRGMMIQGKALDKFIGEKFPSCIRLSIHDHPLDGRKNSIQLFESGVFKTPWHNSVLFDASTGKFIVGKKRELVTEAERGGAIVLAVQFKEKDWLLLQLTPTTPEQGESLRKLKISLYRHDCGLLIENRLPGFDVKEFDNNAMTNLLKHFGVVIFRGFNDFDQIKNLEAWYSTRGTPLQWKFGSTHLVRPEIEGDHPKSSVTSEEALPFHWDMVSPPPDMKIDQAVVEYKDYVPREFVLYCKYSTEDGQGLSTIINSTMVPLTMNGKIRKAMRGTSLAYRTALSYFGGVERTYPVIMNCPWTGNDVVRWWQMWNEKNHPGSVQYNYSRIASSETYEDIDKVEAILTDHCLTESSHFTHEFLVGDIALGECQIFCVRAGNGLPTGRP